MGISDWLSLGLPESIAHLVLKLEFREPMPVQKATIPLFVSNKVRGKLGISTYFNTFC